MRLGEFTADLGATDRSLEPDPPPTAGGVGLSPSADVALLGSRGPEPLTIDVASALHCPPAAAQGSLMVTELYRDMRVAMAELDAKRSELHDTEQALSEVLQDRKARQGENELLRSRIADLELSLREERRRLEAAEGQRTIAEQRCQDLCQDLDRRLRDADALEGRTRAAEASRAQAEQRAEAERASRESAEHAAEVERECRLRLDEEVHAAKLRFAELGAQRNREVKAALLELQALSQGQQTLRSELRRVSRPAPVQPRLVPLLAERMERSPTRGPQSAWDEALEITRARVSAGACDVWQGSPFSGLPRSGSGSLLTGNIRHKADLILAQAGLAECRHQGGG